MDSTLQVTLLRILVSPVAPAAIGCLPKRVKTGKLRPLSKSLVQNTSLLSHHPMTKKFILSLTLSGLFTLTRICSAQTLTPLVHQSPGGANLAFQLTDGTVMCQADSSNDWYKLTPDNTGSYVNG